MAISSNPHWALQDIQALVAFSAPRARCEMTDGDRLVRCGEKTSDGSEVQFEVEWRGRSEADFALLGKELAAAIRNVGQKP